VKYVLKRPIQLAEGEPAITVLTFREEVVAGDMRGIPVREPMHFDDLFKLAGRLSGQPDAVINKMSFADMGEVISIVMGFTGAGQATGNGPSQS
jgi:hypothetical protein